jgi:hypothetical protein
VQVARAFFQASTKLSDDNEDILPQVRGVCATCSLHMLLSCMFLSFAPGPAGRLHVWVVQEDGVDQKLSVFHLFSELFPEYANDKDRDGGNTGSRLPLSLVFVLPPWCLDDCSCVLCGRRVCARPNLAW